MYSTLPFALIHSFQKEKNGISICNCNYHLSNGREGNLTVREGNNLAVPCNLDKKSSVQSIQFKTKAPGPNQTCSWAALQNYLILTAVPGNHREETQVCTSARPVSKNIFQVQNNEIHVKCLQESWAGKLYCSATFLSKAVNSKSCLISFMYISVRRTFCSGFLCHDTSSVYFYCLYGSLPS